ncbi:hypothetical protein [uncultured Methanobrevibacter sp.]|uniref:hypothetical protein n=1 Tax=uncultured Methanobrevibacter sp. TaxID=253161 RepID=UPI0025D056AC|nr:hypothetical protein [uncultured Methanobrevibacter sp.]
MLIRIASWNGGVNEKGEPTISFRKKRDFKEFVGAFNLDEETNSVDLKRSL